MRPAILGAFFVAAGTLHFVKPDAYAAIVPDALPGKREIVYASGVAEIAGGASGCWRRGPGAAPPGG